MVNDVVLVLIHLARLEAFSRTMDITVKKLKLIPNLEDLIHHQLIFKDAASCSFFLVGLLIIYFIYEACRP